MTCLSCHPYRFDAQTGADREVQRILLELLNQMDGFDVTVNVKVVEGPVEAKLVFMQSSSGDHGNEQTGHTGSGSLEAGSAGQEDCVSTARPSAEAFDIPGECALPPQLCALPHVPLGRD